MQRRFHCAARLSCYNIYMQTDVEPKLAHRKQRTWQIIVPLVVCVLLALALAVWAVLVSGSSSPATGQWAAISTVWLVLPVLITLMIFMALVGGLIYVHMLLIRKTPGFFAKIFGYFQQLNALVARLDQAAVQPVLKVNGWKAGWNTFWRQFRR